MRLLILASLLVLAGCATVTADADQNIDVATVPAGAACTLSNDQGSWKIASTPATVAVKRAFQPLQIRCAKSGAGSAEASLEAQTRGRSYGNILMLGVPAVVDAYTGTGYEYAPASITLQLAH